MLRKLAFVTLLLAGVWWFWPLDEATRLRALPPRLAAAFSAGSVGTCLDAFAAEYHDDSEGSRVDKETLRAALLGRLAAGRGAEFVARVPAESIQLVEFDAERGTARLDFALELGRVPAASAEFGAADVDWSLEVEANLARDEHGEWRFVRSVHRTRGGRRPG